MEKSLVEFYQKIMVGIMEKCYETTCITNCKEAAKPRPKQVMEQRYLFDYQREFTICPTGETFICSFIFSVFLFCCKTV